MAHDLLAQRLPKAQLIRDAHLCAMIIAKNEMDSRLAAVKAARICALARRAAEADMIQGTDIDFSNLLERCEEVEEFLEAGCLDFGLDIMDELLRMFMHEFLYYAEFVSEHLPGPRNAQAKSDLRLALTLCYEALGMDHPKVH